MNTHLQSDISPVTGLTVNFMNMLSEDGDLGQSPILSHEKHNAIHEADDSSDSGIELSPHRICEKINNRLNEKSTKCLVSVKHNHL